MSDAGSTPPGGRGGGDQPDFDWLYGKQQRPPGGPSFDKPAGPPPPPSGDHDPTMRIPVQQPPPQQPPYPPQQAYQQRPPVQPTPPQPAPHPGFSPGPPFGGPKRRSGWRRPGRYVLILLTLLVLWIAYLVAVPILTWSNVAKIDYEPDGDRPGDQPGTTYLVVGSDSRGDLSEEERRELGTGGAEGQRTDTILLLHTGSGPTTLVSIPRDTLVTIPGNGENNKVNSAYAIGGAKLLTETIEQTTGIRIDGYVEIGLGGFVEVVDAVGGIEICPKIAIKDPKAKLDIDKGCQEADGVTALGYARTRVTEPGSPIPDFARAQRQREVVRGIGSNVVSPWSVLNPLRYWRINQAAPGAISVGEGMNAIEAVSFARAMVSATGDGGRSCTLPVALEPVTSSSVNDVVIDRERADRLFDILIEDRTDDITNAVCNQKGLAAG